MAWTDPSGHVWVTGETVTAANMNTYIRLNLQETAPAVVTTAGDRVVATGANAITRLAAPAAQVGDGTYTGTGTGDGTYFPLDSANWGSGTSVSVAASTRSRALVHWGFTGYNGGGTTLIEASYDVTGATTISESDVYKVGLLAPASSTPEGTSRTHYVASLTAGTNNFRLKFKASDISFARIIRPWIVVVPI